MRIKGNRTIATAAIAIATAWMAYLLEVDLGEGAITLQDALVATVAGLMAIFGRLGVAAAETEARAARSEAKTAGDQAARAAIASADAKRTVLDVAVAAAKNTAPLLLLALLVGCASNPTNRWAQARESLTTTESLLLGLHAQGVVSDDVLVQADPYIQSARAALEEARERLPDGGTGFSDLLDIVEAALIRLVEIHQNAIQEDTDHAVQSRDRADGHLIGPEDHRGDRQVRRTGEAGERDRRRADAGDPRAGQPDRCRVGRPHRGDPRAAVLIDWPPHRPSMTVRAA